jgi:hypothetical protein
MCFESWLFIRICIILLEIRLIISWTILSICDFHILFRFGLMIVPCWWIVRSRVRDFYFLIIKKVEELLKYCTIISRRHNMAPLHKRVDEMRLLNNIWQIVWFKIRKNIHYFLWIKLSSISFYLNSLCFRIVKLLIILIQTIYQ